jgi:hypothetical protein
MLQIVGNSNLPTFDDCILNSRVKLSYGKRLDEVGKKMKRTYPLPQVLRLSWPSWC